MLAVALGTWNLIGVVVLSLFAGYVIVFASGFDPAHRSKRVGGLFQDPFSETILAYTISLACTAGLLVGFGHITLDDPLASSLAKVIVLGVPASIGGAAGRVVV